MASADSQEAEPNRSALPNTATKSNSPAETEKPHPPQSGNRATAPNRQTRPNLEFQKHGGIVYSESDENDRSYELKCDVYVPEGDGPFPAVLAVHGGSWTSGTKLHMLRHAWRLAKRGYVVVAINYRHAPRFKFPAQIHDCKQAIRWMRHNSAKYKIDSDRIGGYGYSAGGHLISLLATTNSTDGMEGNVPEELKKYKTNIQAAAIGGAPCEFDWIGSSTLAYWIGASKNRRPELYLKASPIRYVDAKDPPFYIYHGSKDALVPKSTTIKMHGKLKQQGVVSTYREVNGKGHFWTFSDFKYLEEAIDFFDVHLKKTKR